VLSEVADDAAMDLQAVKLLATYLSPGLREPGTPPRRLSEQRRATPANPSLPTAAPRAAAPCPSRRLPVTPSARRT
jgi:hypothetical protein